MRARSTIPAAGLLLAALFQSNFAGAAVLGFDFATVPGGNPLPSEITVGGVVAHGFFLQTGQYLDANLWANNAPAEHGIGVCSEGTIACGGTGDVNELSNQRNDGVEVLRLTLPTGRKWSSLWVSSLDVGGSNNNETGTLYWSNLPQPDLSTLSTQHVFSHNDLGGLDEADLLTLPGLTGTFDTSAKYVFFRAGINPAGNDNDYLIWGGNLAAVPEPSSLACMFAGIGALVTLAARRRRAGASTMARQAVA